MKAEIQSPESPTRESPLREATSGERQTRGEKFERVAFSFCKIAFFCLLTQKFALPLAALLAGVFFLLAVWNGQTKTDCWAKKPLWIGLFWLGVVGVWVWHQWFWPF